LVLQKYKTDEETLDLALIFIILGSYLQIIYVDKIINKIHLKREVLV